MENDCTYDALLAAEKKGVKVKVAATLNKKRKEKINLQKQTKIISRSLDDKDKQIKKLQ